MTTAAFADKVRGQASSTTTATVVITSYATASNTIYTVRANALIYNSTSVLMRTGVLIGAFVNKAGTLTQVGATTTLTDHFQSSVLANLPTFNISGTTIQLLTSQGQTVNITWDGEMEVHGYTYS